LEVWCISVTGHRRLSGGGREDWVSRVLGFGLLLGVEACQEGADAELELVGEPRRPQDVVDRIAEAQAVGARPGC
jgi:hypothetical protein